MSTNVVITPQSTRNLHEGTNQSNLQVTIYFSVNLHCTIKMYFLQNKIAYQHECVLRWSLPFLQYNLGIKLSFQIQ